MTTLPAGWHTCTRCGVELPPPPAPIRDAHAWARAPWPVKHRRRRLITAFVVEALDHHAERCDVTRARRPATVQGERERVPA